MFNISKKKPFNPLILSRKFKCLPNHKFDVLVCTQITKDANAICVKKNVCKSFFQFFFSTLQHFLAHEKPLSSASLARFLASSLFFPFSFLSRHQVFSTWMFLCLIAFSLTLQFFLRNFCISHFSNHLETKIYSSFCSFLWSNLVKIFKIEASTNQLSNMLHSKTFQGPKLLFYTINCTWIKFLCSIIFFSIM